MSHLRFVMAAAFASFATVVGLGASSADLAAFRDARFGLFIHWGLYSQLGGRWKGEKMDYIGEWIQSRFRIPNAEYSKIASSFNPVKFNADDWVRQAKEAGMEYVVFTTKHHDGFSMFGTKVSDFNIADATPFGRDVFAELADACRRYGLKVGVYYSQSLDWHEFDAADPRGRLKSRTALANRGMPWGNSWDWPDPSGKNFDRYLKAKVYPQLKELLTNYGEISLIWFDCPSSMTLKHSKELKEYVQSLQPHVLVNGRIGNSMGDFGTLGDNQEVSGASEFLLETPMTLNDTWGFKYDDHNWKNASQVIGALANAISCNANLLLNIGPRPEGCFPEASSDVLKDLADWRKATGFVIKGAQASPFSQAMRWGWCSVAPGNVLQLVVRAGWTNNLELCGIRNAVKDCSHPFEKDGSVLKIKLNSSAGTMPQVVRVTLDGSPDIDKRLMPQQGELVLQPTAAFRMEGKKCRKTAHGTFTDWHHPGDAIVWKAYFPEAGTYSAYLRTESWAHMRPWAGDRKVEVSVGANKLVTDIKKDIPLPHTVYDRADSKVGMFFVAKPGEYEISVRTLEAGPNAAHLDLTMLRLVRAAGSRVASTVIPAVREQTWRDGVCAVRESDVRFVNDMTVPCEGYRIDITTGGVTVVSSDDAGRFYAMKTLRQLANGNLDATRAVGVPCVSITDFPAHRWRGLLLDEGRRFFGKETVKGLLDRMADYKLNVFHWHLTEDQGWRIDIPRFPELVKYGAVRPESAMHGCRGTPRDYRGNGEKYGPFYYTVEDIREILAYAKERFITVVPEIELPGHIRALLAAHPEFACREGLLREPRTMNGIEDDVLCAGNDEAIRFMEKVYDEVCGIFPGTYVHIGGDECRKGRWKECAKCQARIKALGLKDENGLQAWVTRHFTDYLAKKGRRAIGWDEVFAGNPGTKTIIQGWHIQHGNKFGLLAAEAGYPTIVSDRDCTYFDKPQGLTDDPYTYLAPSSRLTLEKAYSFDPFSGMTDTAKRNVMGAECCMWSECVWNEYDLAFKLFPRMCAFAEAVWTAPAAPRDFADFKRRMTVHRRYLIADGVNCAPLD